MAKAILGNPLKAFYGDEGKQEARKYLKKKPQRLVAPSRGNAKATYSISSSTHYLETKPPVGKGTKERHYLKLKDGFKRGRWDEYAGYVYDEKSKKPAKKKSAKKSSKKSRKKKGNPCYEGAMNPDGMGGAMERGIRMAPMLLSGSLASIGGAWVGEWVIDGGEKVARMVAPDLSIQAEKAVRTSTGWAWALIGTGVVWGAISSWFPRDRSIRNGSSAGFLIGSGTRALLETLKNYAPQWHARLTGLGQYEFGEYEMQDGLSDWVEVGGQPGAGSPMHDYVELSQGNGRMQYAQYESPALSDYVEI